jgi:hypothetical protein
VLRLETGRGVVTVRFSGVIGGAGFGWMTQPLQTREPFEQLTHVEVGGSGIVVARGEFTAY